MEQKSFTVSRLCFDDSLTRNTIGIYKLKQIRLMW